MTHLIVLPGNSIKNKIWGALMVATYGDYFDSSFMLAYDHWESGESSINFTREAVKLVEHIQTLPPQTDIILFAKSAGSLLAFMVIKAGVLVPVKCVFFGIPFDLAAAGVFANDWSAVDQFTLPAIAFHNEFDPIAGYVFTREILQVHAPHVVLVTVPEADHSYHNIELYKDTIGTFLK